MSKLKDLAVAYRLSCEFDTCPNDLEEAKEVLGKKAPKNLKNILDNYSGNRPDEITTFIIREIENTDV